MIILIRRNISTISTAFVSSMKQRRRRKRKKHWFQCMGYRGRHWFERCKLRWWFGLISDISRRLALRANALHWQYWRADPGLPHCVAMAAALNEIQREEGHLLPTSGLCECVCLKGSFSGWVLVVFRLSLPWLLRMRCQTMLGHWIGLLARKLYSPECGAHL